MNRSRFRLLPRLIGADKRLDGLNEHQLAVTNQRPFLFTTGFACVLVLIFSPNIYGNPTFLIGIGIVGLSTLPNLIFRNHQAAKLLWLIPCLQFAALAVMRLGSHDYLVGLSLISVFPVIWLAWFWPRSQVIHAANFSATLVIITLPLFLAHETLSVRTVAAYMVVPVILTVIGVFAANVSRSVDAQNQVLADKDSELRASAAESRRRNQLLDAVIETVPVGVVVVDAEGNDLLMNSHQRSMHQLGLPDDIPDPTEAQLLIFGEDRVTPLPAEKRPVRRAVEGESFTNQLIWLGDERRRRALSVSASTMKDHDGAPAGSVTVFSDVTDLVDALAIKDAFLQGISHELRTPLTSILGYIDLVLEEAKAFPETDHLCEKLRVAERNASRLLQLVTDMLSSASRPSMHLTHGDLAEVVDSSVTSACPQADAVGVTLSHETSSPLRGRFDPTWMHSAVDNLLSNAIKYTPAGGTVTVHAWKEDERLWVRVTDTGRGISEEDQRDVFEKFFRASDVRDSAIQGVGLGLAITKQVVDAHHGSITVESALEQGTTFTLSIPSSAAGASSENKSQPT